MQKVKKIKNLFTFHFTLFAQSGFSLIEVLIGSAIFAMVGGFTYFGYSNVVDILNAARFHNTALALIQGEIESARNLPYEKIGIQGGVPAGILPAQKTVTLDGVDLVINTTVRNIDDPFDGTIGGAPNDLAPADYRLVEFEVTCLGCAKFLPARMTARLAPKNLENSSSNGALFITVIDAAGQLVSGANVSVVNSTVNPPISLNDTTGVTGELQLVDTATSSIGYQITVTKSGYSTDQTRTPGLPQNPNPLLPHASVAKQQLTRITLSIDRTGSVNLTTQDPMCKPVAGIDYLQTGAKLIGTNPDVLKYSASLATDAQGQKNINNLEWDTYTLKNTSATYDLSGSTAAMSMVVNPNSSQTVTWTVEPKLANALLVSVHDSNQQPINEATIRLTKTSYDQTQTAGHRFFSETSWAASNYDSKSLYMDPVAAPSSLTLESIGGQYPSQSLEWLISKTIDFGTNNITYDKLEWNPATQPLAVGPNSLQIQVAANNDNLNWSFVGPDGTPSSYFVVSGTALPATLANNRYFRYKVFLQTIDDTATPSLDDLSIGFRSACSPNHQTFFSGLTAGTYSLTVTKTGFQPFTDASVSITEDWKEYDVTLTP